MKKKFLCGMIALLSSAFVFMGCPGGDDDNKQKSVTKPAKSASVENVTITGTTGTELTGEVTITLKNETFTAIKAGDDLKSWFSNLPADLSAKATEKVMAGTTTVKITIAGKPSKTASEALKITIPKENLTGKAKLDVTTNTQARFNITAAKLAKSATVSDKTISGKTGTELTGEVTITITLENETFTAIKAETELKWITNLPIGLKAKAKADATSTSVTLVITGTPTAAKTEALKITIPKENLTGQAKLDVTTNTQAKFEIN
ncbi:MAG: hypothetical protein LBO67_08490 [Spirochaetaceae bacterium]|jgi:hypothetical protein|nr:hypothetical protein [Spirochaetaceae bacterium]